MWVLIVITMVVGQSTGSGANVSTTEIEFKSKILCETASKQFISDKTEYFNEGSYSRGYHKLIVRCLQVK